MGNTQSLKSKILNVFSQESEVTNIYTFGSINSTKFDKYSDIDLTIVTSDIHKTSTNLLNTLNNIDDVLAIFTLTETETSAAYTVFFKNFSLFQKLDIGITIDGNHIFENSKLEYENRNALVQNPSSLSKQKESNIDHEILDIFIGALRYIKYIKRDEVWLAYKFYKSFVEIYLKSNIDPTTNTKLDLEGYKKVQEELGNRSTDLIFISSQDDMSKMYLKYLNQLFEINKSSLIDGNIELIQRILTLFNEELIE
jgi:predicted nucleotidyltransferase